MTAHSTPPKAPAGWLINGVIVFGVLLILALPVGLIVGGLQSKPHVEPIPGGITTTGTVENISGRTALHGHLYTPTIAFSDRDGHVHLFDGPTDASSPKIGDHVRVSYDPNNPDHVADISAGSLTWQFPFWSGIVIAVLEVPAAIWVVRRRRAMKRGDLP